MDVRAGWQRMKTYRAGRGSAVVLVHSPDAPQRDLKPRLELKRYCGYGFAWGSSSSGCMQLALALLCDALDNDERALALHEAYCEEYVRKLNRDYGFMLTQDTVKLDARLIEDRKARAS